jgi:hypothetical protein
MRKDFELTAVHPDVLENTPDAPAKRPVIALDVSLYDAYLRDSGLSEEQTREFLEALWIIIVGFVDLGFGIHPVQQVLNDACVQMDESGGSDPAGLLPFQHIQEEEKGEQPYDKEKP